MELVALIVVTLTLLVLVAGGVGKWHAAEHIGRTGELRTINKLSHLPATEYTVLNDIMLADSNGNTTQIDHIVVSQFGIFVIETKCYKGWMFGDEKSRVWTQTLPCGRGWWAHSEKHTFQNPIKQNWRHIYVLSELLNLPKRYFFNVVVFSGTAEFKTTVPDNVMSENDIVPYIKSFDMPIISSTKKEEIVSSLQMSNNAISEQQRANHVNKLHIEHSLPITIKSTAAMPTCPRCGAPMILRRRRSDNARFYGCSRYPKCKGSVNVR